MGIILRGIRPIRAGSAEAPAVDCRIAGGSITEIGWPEIPARPDDQIIDGRGKWAISGFVNAHTHLPMVLLRGRGDDLPLDAWLHRAIWPIERRLNADDVYWGSVLAIAESIRSGTVAVADMYFHVDAVAEAVEASGIRGLLSYGIVAAELDARGRREVETAADLVRKWDQAANGRIRIAIAPHSVSTCGEAVWRRAVETAAALGRPIHTHLAETRSEVAEWCARTGEHPVAYLDRIGALRLPTIAAHVVHVGEREIDLLASRGVRVAHCPKSNAKLGSGIAPVVRMLDAGVTVALGTDGAASNNRLDPIEELRTACFLQRAAAEDPGLLSADRLIGMATDAGRAALGLPPALTAGGAADIVLVDADALHASPPHDPRSMLVYAAAAGDITDVIVAGRFLMRDRELLTVDEERAKAEVKRRLHRLLEGVPRLGDG